jgi:hypothetical protein
MRLRNIGKLNMFLMRFVQVFRLVASILKLGNLTFIPTTNMDGTEGATVGNEYGT